MDEHALEDRWVVGIVDARREHQRARDAAGGSNWITLERMARLDEKAHKFMFVFVFTPLRLKGATGSPGRPLAIL